MCTILTHLRSLLGGLGCYRKFITADGNPHKALESLAPSDGWIDFIGNHVALVRSPVVQIGEPKRLGKPGLQRGSLRGLTTFVSAMDASIDGLGGTMEQRQKDGVVRPLCFFSRSILPNRRCWTTTGLGNGPCGVDGKEETSAVSRVITRGWHQPLAVS